MVAILLSAASADDSMVTGTHGFLDYWICKIDSLGNFEWGKSLGGTNEDVPNSLIETNDGFLIAGYSNSIDGDVSGIHYGLKDVWAVKLSSPGLNVIEKGNCLMELTISQSYEKINIRFFSKSYQSSEICIYNSIRKLVLQKNIFVNEGINYHNIDCGSLSTGMYFVRIDSEKGSLNGKVVFKS